MRKTRLVAGLVATACAAALPAAAAAHDGGPGTADHRARSGEHGHAGAHGDRSRVRLAPAAGQSARGVAVLQQRAGALTVALVVSHLTPGAFFAAHVHSGTCAAPTGVALTLPDVYADEDGIARLLTTLPTAPGANDAVAGFSVDVHTGPSTSPTASVAACGDVAAARVPRVRTTAWLKGTAVNGRAEAVQKGSAVTVWVSLRGLAAGAHAVHLHLGACSSPGALAVDLGDVTAGADGRVRARLTAVASAAVVAPGSSLDVQAGASGTPEAPVACGDQLQARRHGHR